MNTPRNQLADQILETKSGDITKTLKPYAIGKWVPVSERLPGDGRVVIARWSNGFTSYYTFVRPHMSLAPHITHWLYLSMPEVEE